MDINEGYAISIFNLFEKGFTFIFNSKKSCVWNPSA